LSTQALDSLVETVSAAFREGARGGRLTELLGEYARAHDDWRAFALTSPEHYTRNLVARQDAFELMILCWGPGQESPIHNHEGQDCWMAVLDGSLEEVRYPMPAGDAPGPLSPAGAQTFARGQVAFIRDEMGLHLVRPPASSGGGGVSMHLYSAPFAACNCYCPDTGRITRTQLAYHSIRGKLRVS